MDIAVIMMTFVIVVIGLVGLMLGYQAVQNRKGIMDSEASRAVRKYLFIASPIFWMYVSFAVVFLMMILMYSFFYEG